MVIEKGKMIVEGNNLIETEKGITCGCENPSLQMISHFDFKDSYSTTYKCTCGNIINVTCKRDRDDLMYWDNFEDNEL